MSQDENTSVPQVEAPSAPVASAPEAPKEAKSEQSTIKMPALLKPGTAILK